MKGEHREKLSDQLLVAACILNDFSVIGQAAGRHHLHFAAQLGHLADRSFDLCVIGTSGRTGLANVLLGSIAEKVVRRAACPTLTIRRSGMRP